MRVRRRGRNHHVFFAAKPQDCCGDEHERARNAERDRGAEMPQEDWHQKRCEERTDVDYPIKRLEHHLGAVLVSLVELVADKCGDTWFDSARPERDQSEPDVKTGAVRDKHRQAGLTYTVNKAEPEDRVVFTKKPVSQPTAQQWEKVNANHERVKNILGAARAFGLRQIKKQRRDEENRQDVPHPVKTEAFASLVSDDVADLFRDRCLRIGRNARKRQ